MPLIDPELLPLVDEVRAENAAMVSRAAQAFAAFDPDGDAVAQARALMEEGGVFGQPVVAEATERTVPGPAGDIPIRVFVPPTVDAIYLSIHGGAFSMGSRRSSDRTNWQIAQSCNAAVVSPEYRMAPEHRWPSGHDDCEAVALWLLAHGQAELGASSDRLLVGGESAGAHIAAVTALQAARPARRDRPRRAAPISTAACTTSPARRAGCSRRRSTTSWQRPGAGQGCRAAATSRCCRPTSFAPPDASPLYADLRGLCPALFTVGTADSLLDDSVFMACRWELAGNETELAVYPYGPHGLTGSPTEMGRRAPGTSRGLHPRPREGVTQEPWAACFATSAAG